MEAIRISDFRLYGEITDGKSITYMIAGLNKEYGDVVESGLLFADPSVVERETDELIEKLLLSSMRIVSNINITLQINKCLPWVRMSIDALRWAKR